MTRTVEVALIAALLLLYPNVPNGLDEWILTLNLGLFYALLARAMFSPTQVVSGVRTYFTVEVLFLLFYFLIFYLPYQQYLFGFTNPAASRFLVNTFVDGSNVAITLSTIGALAFSLGHRLIGVAAPSVSPLPEMPLRDAHSARQVKVLSHMTTGLLTALVLLYLVAGWRTEGEGRYTQSANGGVAAEGVSTIILMLAMVAIAIWVYSLSISRRPDGVMLFGFTIAILWGLRWLVLGDRNSFLLLAIVLFAGLFTFVRQVSLVWLVVGFLVSLVLYNAVEILRMPELAATASIWEILNGTANAKSDTGESSFNITTVTLRASVMAVPQHYDFAFGTYKIVGILGVFPLFRGLFISQFNPEYTASSQLLGDVMLGPGAIWNVGSNVVSDAYMDFGVPGVVIILGIVGAFAAAMRNRATRKPGRIGPLVMYLLTVSLFAELPRYSVDFPVRILVWAGLLVGASSLFVGRDSRSKNTLTESLADARHKSVDSLQSTSPL